MPLLRTKKEVFEWLRQGKKTIDIRKGYPHCGEFAFFQTGPHQLKLKIAKKETGRLTDIVRSDNYGQVIPSAETLENAIDYLRRLYDDYDGVFTAYYAEPQRVAVNERCGKF